MPLSASDIEWLLAREGAEPGIWLLTVTGGDLPGGVLRMARSTAAVTSNGNVFAAGWFDVTLPEESDRQPGASLSVPNVDRLVGYALVDATETLTVKLELVRPANYNQVIYAAELLKLRQVSIDPLTVEGTLSVAQLDSEPYGSIRVVPANFPWLNYV